MQLLVPVFRMMNFLLTGFQDRPQPRGREGDHPRKERVRNPHCSLRPPYTLPNPNPHIETFKSLPIEAHDNLMLVQYADDFGPVEFCKCSHLVYLSSHTTVCYGMVWYGMVLYEGW